MMHQLRRASWIACLLLLGLTRAGSAAEPALLELKVGKQVFFGKTLAHDSDSAWLLERDGQLRLIELKDVTSFRKVGSRFSRLDTSAIRDSLRRELGQGLEIAGSGHYLVAAAPGRVNQFAQIFEDVYRAFHIYFTARGFSLREPEFPMVAIVFPGQADFARYAKAEGVTVNRGFRGYYLCTSNRTALYDSSTAGRAGADSALPFGLAGMDDDQRRFPLRQGHLLHPAGRVFGSIEAGLEGTMIHEATHQVAFNTGLHSRIGWNPKWVSEGLATLFEAPGIRNGSGQGGLSTRLNRERYVWHGNYRQARRKSDSLRAFVASDALFESGVLDAYSEAWALTFFLVETRSRQYSDYLRRIAARPPLEEYTSAQRVEDFQSAFGDDLKLLDAAFLRFVDGLK